MIQNIFQYLYANWAYSSILIAIYSSLIIWSSRLTMDPFIFFVWLQFPIYLLHEFEEHGYPGGFQDHINTTIFASKKLNSPFDPERIFWINILAVWVLFPLGAVLAQLVHPAFGIILPCFGLTNATLHILSFLKQRMYNPGLLVSIFLNYPTGIYTLHLAHKEGILTVANTSSAFVFSIIAHIMIVGSAVYWYRQGIKNKH